jgi:hypothetical protein
MQKHTLRWETKIENFCSGGDASMSSFIKPPLAVYSHADNIIPRGTDKEDDIL